MLDDFRINVPTLLTLQRRREPRPTFHPSRRLPNLIFAGTSNRNAVERLVCSFGTSHTWENMRIVFLVALQSLRAVVIGLDGVERLALQTGS